MATVSVNSAAPVLLDNQLEQRLVSAQTADLVDQVLFVTRALVSTLLGTDLGTVGTAVKEAAASLSNTPAQFGPVEIEQLRAGALNDFEITNVISTSAFLTGLTA